ncbi:transporter substrate-binding domain-containing protein [Rufibacter soli]
MTKKNGLLLLLLFAFWGTSGCDKIPKDPEDTLRQVTGGTLHVGYSENPPWVVKGAQEPTGLEPEMVKAFAKTINARVQWHQDTEQELLEALEKKKLQLVVAGLTDDSPWKSKISFTRPYLTLGKKKHVFGVVMGENAFVMKLEKFLHKKEEELKKQQP